MPIRIPRPWQLPESAVTPEPLFRARRRFLAAGGAAALGALAWPRPAAAVLVADTAAPPKLSGVTEAPRFSTDEAPNDWDAITSYNNFYELGTGKGDPKANARQLPTGSWTLRVDGACAKPATFGLEDLRTAFPLEERIYRLRCVEAWSMVVPWVGFPLKALLDRVEPLGSARFVRFETLLDRERLPGQRVPVLPWPYVEGLRLDEAGHPLTILGVGLYGREMPAQNGAPVRLVVPWKYGFKSIKSIVRITLTEEQPKTTWNALAPHEYGFYANVNPAVDHPRWSQASERRIGDFLKRDTLPFNGYAEEVAGLYAGMDLTKAF